jgi:L-ascorbate metabolism protein UlaG (beta-lactamase superfamily)
MAHQVSVTYVANEAVLITNGDKKVLFDPFFSSSFWYLSVSATGDPAGHI